MKSKFKKVDKSAIKKGNQEFKKQNEKNKPLLELTEDKLDGIVNRPIGGKWEGFKFSELAEDPEGRSLLRWITQKEFPKEIMQIAQDILEDTEL